MPIVTSPHVEILVLSQCSMHRVRDRALKMSFKDVKEPVEVHRSFVSAARTNNCRCSAGICVALATTLLLLLLLHLNKPATRPLYGVCYSEQWI